MLTPVTAVALMMYSGRMALAARTHTRAQKVATRPVRCPSCRLSSAGRWAVLNVRLWHTAHSSGAASVTTSARASTKMSSGTVSPSGWRACRSASVPAATAALRAASGSIMTRTGTCVTTHLSASVQCAWCWITKLITRSGRGEPI
jgi:hypothetical protein